MVYAFPRAAKTKYHKLGILKKQKFGNSPAVLWLGLCTSTAKGPGFIPGRGTKIPQAVRHSQKNPEINFLAALEARILKPRCRWGWLLLRL